jgi:hypothetical protein
MCAAPGRICKVALGRRLARAVMAAGVDTWSSSAAMSVAGIRMEAVRPAQRGQSRNLLRDKQREVECDLPAEGVADDVQAAARRATSVVSRAASAP